MELQEQAAGDGHAAAGGWVAGTARIPSDAALAARVDRAQNQLASDPN